MTKEQKSHRILEIKAQAFDEIDDLRLTIDSHRNFHHRVSNTIREARLVIYDVEQLRTGEPSEQFICQWPQCRFDAVSQISSDDEGPMFYCAHHARIALMANGRRLVVAEDRVLEPEDLQ